MTTTYLGVRIEAAEGLAVRVSGPTGSPADAGDHSNTVAIEWAETSWFGPGRLTVGGVPHDLDIGDPVAITDDIGTGHGLVVHSGGVEASVRAYRDLPMIVFRLEATTELTGLATGTFADPYVGWPIFTPAEREPGDVDVGSSALVFQCCEFGFPSNSGVALDRFFLLPHRPATGWPMLIGAPDGRTLMLVPIDSFHDQSIGLNGGTVRCGWHGDLDVVHAGFSTGIVVIAGGDARSCIDTWGELLRRRAATIRPGRWPDALGTRPSYWTDNGAAYWHRTGARSHRIDRGRRRRSPRSRCTDRICATGLMVVPPCRPPTVRHRRVGGPAIGDDRVGAAPGRVARRHRITSPTTRVTPFGRAHPPPFQCCTDR